MACLHVYVLQGGMMEEWHQKLHNNSSPDDLAICQALLDYLASGQDIKVYWDSLAKERKSAHA
jgi:alpha-glucan,water dikinase